MSAAEIRNRGTWSLEKAATEYSRTFLDKSTLETGNEIETETSLKSQRHGVQLLEIPVLDFAPRT